MKIKTLLLWVAAFLFAVTLTSGQTTPASELKPDQPSVVHPKVLVIYFSYTGHTKEIANQIHSIVGGDLFEIVPEIPYSLEDYKGVVDQAREEKKQNARPKVKNKLPNPGDYDIVFIGFPIWWYTYPMVVATFLEETDFSGKTLVPFCTHEGSRFAESLDDLRLACPRSTILKGFEANGKRVDKARPNVEKWISSLNLGIKAEE